MTTKEEFQQRVNQLVDPSSEKLKSVKIQLANEFNIDQNDIQIYKIIASKPNK